MLDRLIQELTPSGVVDYQYDALGRRTTLVADGQTPVVYTYDAASRLVGIGQGATAVGFGYDAGGRRTHVSLPNGL